MILTELIVSAIAFSALSILIGAALFQDRQKTKRHSARGWIDRLLLFITGLFFLSSGLLFLQVILFLLHSSYQHVLISIYDFSFGILINYSSFPWWCLLVFSLWLVKVPPESANPLEWCAVDRCLLLVWIIFFRSGMGTVISGVGKLLSVDPATWINVSFLSHLHIINLSISWAWIFLLLAGFWLRPRSPDNAVYVHTVIQFSAVCMAMYCYIYGALTQPDTWLQGLATCVFYLLLFNLATAVSGMITFLFLAIGSTAVAGLGLIPYAPAISASPYAHGKISMSYWSSALSWVTMTSLVMLFLIGFIVVRWRSREIMVSKMSALLKKMFGRYLSTEVMNSIIENPESLELGGERRNVTVMVTDLRGFTAISERLEPEKVVDMLNVYFEVMLDVAHGYQGTVNSIIGDGLLIVFGAPQNIPDSAQRAVACAISMQNAMARVNDQIRREGMPELEMGIGLNAAEVIVGNIGSSKRSKYTVIGSGVNIAGRIESYTVGGQILISDSVRCEAGDTLRIDGRQKVFPKGVGDPLTIYEVGGIAGEYHVALDDRELPMRDLTRQIPVLCAIIGDKQIGQEGQEGLMVRLSTKTAEIRLNCSVEILADLKMNIAHVTEEISQKDFYGKIIKHAKDQQYSHIVRFTSLPPEIGSYFEAYLQHAGA